MNGPYTREEERRLRAAVRGGAPLLCPSCDVPLEVQAVPPRPDVAYVRSRRWLRCGTCGRSLVVDEPRGGPGHPSGSSGP